MKRDSNLTIEALLPLLYFIGRIFLFIGMVPDAFYWAGDLNFYYLVAQLPGWPFIHHWIEYPPLFPFLCEVFNIAAGGSEFVFSFILTVFLAAAGAGSIWLFNKIARHTFPPADALLRTIIYFGFISVIPYTWWYYEMLVVLLILAANWAMINQKDRQTGLWIGLGILTKWFPVFILPALWRQTHCKRALRITAVALSLVVLVFGILYLVSPQMTAASLAVQPGRSSWQTVWALIDNNKVLGTFIEMSERLTAANAYLDKGSPAVIPTWLTLLLIGGLGLYFLIKVRPSGTGNLLAAQGFTWVLFLIWSPGWSPQWILYLLPLILLTLPVKQGLTFALSLTLLTLIEWPLLLGRHLFDALWVIAPLRMILFALLAFQWIKISQRSESTPASPT